MTEEFRVGVISSVHGIRGEAKVFVTSDDPARFLDLKTVTGRFPRTGTTLRPGNAGTERILEIQSVRFSKNMAICKFRGIDTPEEMQKLRGMELWVDREHAVPLEEGEYYIADLIGLRVVTEEGLELGTVEDIWPTGANYVITVKQKNGNEILLPYIPDCVKEVRLSEGEILIHLMEGLL